MLKFPENTHQGMIRRIYGDINLLIKSGICDGEDVYIGEPTISPFYGLDINIKSKLTGDKYCFTLPNDYPFNVPKLYINSVKYPSTNHNLLNKQFNNKLLLYTGIECFCCDTILCKNNWTPRVTMKDIIEESERYKNACKLVVYSVIIDVIKRKYLNNDINIFQWLL